jgi:hypothetical protein
MEAVLQGPSGLTVLGVAVLTIGRTADNQLVVNDPKASSHHAEVRPSEQGYSIIDLGSTNGTFVNNQRLDRNVPRPLANGDRIRIGDTVFNYTATDVAPGSYSPPGGYSEYSPTVVAGSFVEPSAGPSEYTGYGQGAQPPYMSPPPYGSAQQQYPPPPAYPPYPPPAASAELPGRMQGPPPFPASPPPLQAAPVSPQPYPPPTYLPDRVPSPKPGGRSRILLIALAIIIVLGVGSAGIATYLLTRPHPQISVISKYHVGQTPAGSTSTTFHVSGQNFPANSAITFLLDGTTAPGSVTVQSDAKGNVQADLTVTSNWIVGNHTLTARDANNNSTKSGIPVTIVPQGEASTPGPNGAPPDDMKFTLNTSIQATDTSTGKAFSPFSQTLIVTGQPDPAGGTVCQSRDNGQLQNIPGTFTGGGSYTEVLVFQCSGTYKAGKLSYTETATSDKYMLADGGTCTVSTPYMYEQMEGSFTAPNTISGRYSSVATKTPCTDNTNVTSDATSGSWTGQSS